MIVFFLLHIVTSFSQYFILMCFVRYKRLTIKQHLILFNVIHFTQIKIFFIIRIILNKTQNRFLKLFSKLFSQTITIIKEIIHIKKYVFLIIIIFFTYVFLYVTYKIFVNLFIETFMSFHLLSILHFSYKF